METLSIALNREQRIAIAVSLHQRAERLDRIASETTYPGVRTRYRREAAQLRALHSMIACGG